MSSHPGTASATLTNVSGSTAAQRGRGTLTVRHNKSGIIWRISQLAVLSQPAGQMTLDTYFNDLPLMSPVTVYSGDCADGPPSIDLGDHDNLKIDVSYGPPGANVILAYYYEEIPSS